MLLLYCTIHCIIRYCTLLYILRESVCVVHSFAEYVLVQTKDFKVWTWPKKITLTFLLDKNTLVEIWLSSYQIIFARFVFKILWSKSLYFDYHGLRTLSQIYYFIVRTRLVAYHWVFSPYCFLLNDWFFPCGLSGNYIEENVKRLIKSLIKSFIEL